MASTVGGAESASSSSISISVILEMKSPGSLNRCSRQFLRSSSSSLVNGGGGGGEKGEGGEGEDMRRVRVV